MSDEDNYSISDNSSDDVAFSRMRSYEKNNIRKRCDSTVIYRIKSQHAATINEILDKNKQNDEEMKKLNEDQIKFQNENGDLKQSLTSLGKKLDK